MSRFDTPLEKGTTQQISWQKWEPHSQQTHFQMFDRPPTGMGNLLLADALGVLFPGL